ncbi:cyclic nucleotide-binding domain-containing protein [Hymenobacter terricola]|uniref:cyclic nucleotide-binding domain-containing protein n=1 Tax=Hymenobacter terricola TaxID=2819236 RepID=UPI001B314D85|nr:cyclic nucleotide-binding domain-containing protein [Hymenobacter terricola]
MKPKTIQLVFGPALVLANVPPSVRQWGPWLGMSLLAVGALFLLRVYRKRRAQRHFLERALLKGAHQAQIEPTADEPTSNTPGPDVTGQLIAMLSVKASREAAVDSLVELGEAGLPQLKQALAQETDARRLQRLAQVCVRMDTAAARQLLVEIAQTANLPARAAALRALSHFATVPADAPLFHRLIEEELQFAQHLLHGMVAAAAELCTALQYELRQCQLRLFGLLLQVYARPIILEAQRGLAHAGGHRQAEALGLLDKLIPRPLYRGLQALLDGNSLGDQVQTFDDLLGSPVPLEPIATTVVRRGLAAFSAWTISLALRQWHPQPATVAYLYPHLQTGQQLIREGAVAVLQRLPEQRPAAYDQFLTLYSAVIPLLMSTLTSTSCVSAPERVRMLKGTALFAETPENILGTIIPIMKEISFEPEQEIFVKGTLGTSLFIVCEGEVGIFNGAQQLATFHKGDFFGELALLDAEPRSATAVAQGPVVAFRLDQEDFYDVMEERSEVLHSILRVLCQRLRHQNEMAQAAH